MSQDAPAVVSQAIRDRRTVKVFADPPLPADAPHPPIEDLLDAASWAPFHRPAAKIHQEGGPLSSKVPWRFHILDAAACRKLRERLLNGEGSGKVPAMLAAATTLIQATWLPNPPKQAADAGGLLFEPTVENMEHIAAAAAAIQNLLVAATAHGIPNYWSSGGVLRERQAFEWLGIPSNEILLGAVFLFPPGSDGPDVATGKLRDQRGTQEEWSRWVELD